MKNQRKQTMTQTLKKIIASIAVILSAAILSYLLSTESIFASVSAMALSEVTNIQPLLIGSDDILPNPRFKKHSVHTDSTLRQIIIDDYNEKYDRINNAINNLYTNTKAIREQEIKDRMLNVVCDPTDITKISGMNVEQMKIAFNGTWLEGQEELLVRFEQDYSVNVFFLYAISTWESGHGQFVNAERNKKRQNYYGINLNKEWKDFEDNTLYWGGMINRVYIDKGHKSVKDISPIYCPPNPDYGQIIADTMISVYNNYMVNINLNY